ncbi:46190_t:CDS:2, partial [Gigaspora margarita]
SINNRFTNKKQKKESTSEGLKKNELVDNLKATNKFIKEKEKEIDKKTFQYNNSILEAEKEELGKRIEKLKKENNKHIKDRSNTILKLIKAELVLNYLKRMGSNINKKKYHDTFTKFFGYNVDKLGIYYDMKLASKTTRSSWLNLPCIDVCNPEEEIDGKKKTISDKLVENIKNIFFRDVSHMDPYGTFFKEVEIEEINNIDGTKKIKISKPKYTTDNFALKPLVKWGRLGQTSNDKKASKAPRMKLRGCFTEFSFIVILNAQSKDFEEFKIFKPLGPFIITLTFLEVMNSIDHAVDINEITKEVQNFCVCKPYKYKFQIYMYTAHDGSSVPKNDLRIPFCIKPSKSDEILLFVTVIVNPKSLQEKIDSTIQLNENVLKNNPVDLEDILFFGTEPNSSIFLPGLFLIVNHGIVLFGYDTNMDSLYNLRLTGSAALQQLIDAIKSEVPITLPNNDSANTTKKQNNELTI